MSDKIKQIALVTGATRGIGRAIAIRLAKNGIFVIGTATSENGVNNINEYLQPFNGTGALLDVTNKDSITNLVNQIHNNYGEITILINNAGITKDVLFLRMQDADWDNVINTNLRSTFLLTKSVIRGMTKLRYGRIVNLTSVVAFTGNHGQANYSSSKAGIIAFSKSLAQEFASRNITVNCVAPGFIETDMTDKLPKEIRDEYIKSIPLGRLGNVDDIASSVNFLVSEDANYITGTTIHVNGGLYM